MASGERRGLRVMVTARMLPVAHRLEPMDYQQWSPSTAHIELKSMPG